MMGDTSENSTTGFLKYEESTDQIMDSSLVEKFTCILCGLKFSQQEYLTNHFKVCNDVEDPVDTLDVDISTIKKELNTEDEMHSMEMFDQHATEPILHIKLEEIDFTETTISGAGSPQSGQPSDSLKTDAPEELVTFTTDDYTTAQPTQLEEQVKVHKPFMCTLCDYASERRGHLEKHVRTHTGAKPFKCTICAYACVQRCHLKEHMRTHTREKPFKCTICDYASAQGSHLKEHMRTHSGEKPFKCSMCDYAGARRCRLVQHEKTHTGLKPFKCTICDYACVQSIQLIHHVRTHTGEKPFKCTICDYASAWQSALTTHMKRHASGDQTLTGENRHFTF